MLIAFLKFMALTVVTLVLLYVIKFNFYKNKNHDLILQDVMNNRFNNKLNEMATRREFVTELARSSWAAYVKYNWGDNALEPVSDTFDRKFSGSQIGHKGGRTIFASLSTFLVMGLEKEFAQGKQWIVGNFSFENTNTYANIFGHVTHYIGGLLSAYALTGDELFLKKAEEFAVRIESAYNTSTGIPRSLFNLKDLSTINPYPSLSTIGGQYLEHAYLSDLTAKPQYRQQVTRIREHLEAAAKPNGLYYARMNINGQWDAQTSSLFGDSGGHYYRNLLLSYIQSGQSEQSIDALEAYRDAIEAMDRAEMFKEESNGIIWVREYDAARKQFGEVMEYSACLAGAMLIQGATVMQSLGGTEEEKATAKKQIKRHSKLADKLTETCYQASMQAALRLGPREFQPQNNFKVVTSDFLLSPELAESYFILWRRTRDPKYRQMAWEMAQAIGKYCRTDRNGFSGLKDVNNPKSGWTNHQPADFFSGTLLYLYLTFSDDNVLPLDQWIFNSVGHPLPICGKHKAYPAKLCKS